MPRGVQLARQWRIIQVLTAARKGKSARELSRMLGCHSRTVYRDLEALQQAGFPVYTDRDAGQSVWAILDAAREPVPAPFRLAELMALYFSRDLIRPLRGTPFHEALESLFEKIRATLPEGTAAFMDQMGARIGIGAKPHKDYSRSGAILETIQQALLERRCLDITYYSMSRHRSSRRRVAPYHLWFYDGTFYLIGHCSRRDGIRTFAVDRIRSCKSTEEIFDEPAGFDPTVYMASSFGVFHGPPVLLRVRFSPVVAGYIRERVWHATQTLTPGADGSLLFEAEVADSDEIRYWIRRWGAEAEVLSPESIREAIRTDIGRLAEVYGMEAARSPARVAQVAKAKD
ncbi:MAG: helix-turn-helix transcriptional regulator [Desulfobacterales bacterium]